MGMFDQIICRYPLPIPGANDLDYQTKSLDCVLDDLEIREDGSLWKEHYDVEDHSDPKANGIASVFGSMARVNLRWEPEPYTGEICFHTSLGKDHSGWIDFSAWFADGKIKEVSVLQHRVPRS